MKGRTRFFLTIWALAVAALFVGVAESSAQYVPPPPLAPGVNYMLPNYAYSPIMRKFVDGLPGLTATGVNNLGQYIPVAIPDNNAFPGSSYYELALVDFTERMHSDLGPSKIRGYVQVETPANAGVSKHIPLPGGLFAVDNPHYLGPAIVAAKGTATRVKFYNLLAAGPAGDLFIPTDLTLMGAGMGPNGVNYSQNRAIIHLHGGDNPWISDGTPHQWITPAGQAGTLIKGMSQQNVPDMPAPPPGSATYYWTNGQTGRLMFYHDHALGTTRLDVYAGEVAPYLLTDPTERGLNSFAPGGEVPLVVQDKTFVNDGSVPAGFTGVPTPATTTVDPLWATGGPWPQTKGSFWFPHVYMPNQNPNDLSGANMLGRWDYGPWFWPVFPSAIPPQTSTTPEAFMDTPVINGAAYPYVNVDPKAYRFRILNGANDRYVNLQMYVADPGGYAINAAGAPVAPGTGFGTEVRMIPAVKNNGIAAGALDSIVAPPPPFVFGPVSWPAAWTANDTPGMIPNILDSRQGGVPDPSPSLMGPSFIHIGSEGGVMPQAVELPNTPIGYEENKRSVTVLNTMEHTLFLGPAERADVIVDFSQFAGKTIIVYNDSPAPVPAGDPRYDFYTGDLDNTFQGGAPSTSAGFGPNMRTIMQIRVSNTLPDPPLNLAALNAAVGAVFTATQAPLIVPPNTYARISDTSMTFGGSTAPLLPKTIQELFDPYGRMNATLGVEIPFTTATVQTTIPYGYADPPTELIPDGGTQLWKITHNGVDTHAMHFHLFNVQLVNRVGWDGAIKPPWPEEIGWKETVKMNPLEDVVVALKAKTPTVPFKMPNSVRPLNPVLPLGSTMGFLGVDPNGNPVTVTNQVANFGNEYVWHCHLLGHEENDMMRAMLVAPNPESPSNLVGSVNGTGNNKTAILSWTDNSLNATGFTVQRATNPAFTANLVSTQIGKVTAYTEPIPNQQFYYRVFATDLVGSGVAGYPMETGVSGFSNTVLVNPATPPAAPSGLTAKVLSTTSVRLNWTDNSTNEDNFRIQRSVNGGAFSLLATVAANVVTFTDTTVTAGNRYSYRVYAQNVFGVSAFSPQYTVNVPTGVPAAPSGLTATVTSATSVRLNWTDNSTNEDNFGIQRAVNGGAFSLLATVGANIVTFTDTTVTAGNKYTYRVYAQNALGVSAFTPQYSVTVAAGTAPAAPSGLSVTVLSPTSAQLNWTDNSTNETGFGIQRAVNGGAFSLLTTVGANVVAYTDNTVSSGNRYSYRVYAVNSFGVSSFTAQYTVNIP